MLFGYTVLILNDNSEIGAPVAWFSVFPISTHPQYNSSSFFRAGNMLVFNSLTTY